MSREIYLRGEQVGFSGNIPNGGMDVLGNIPNGGMDVPGNRPNGGMDVPGNRPNGGINDFTNTFNDQLMSTFSSII